SMKHAGEVARPRRVFGLGRRRLQGVRARHGEPSGMRAAGVDKPSALSPANWEADGEASREATMAETLVHRWAGVIRGLLFFLGLGITTWGILIARSHALFEWLPAGLRAATARYLDNNQGVIVGGAIALAGAI